MGSGYVVRWYVADTIPCEHHTPAGTARPGTPGRGEAPQVGRPYRDRRKQAARRRAARTARGKR